MQDFIFADLGWTDGFIYIDRVSVEAQNQTGHRMWFTLKFLPHADWDKGLEYYVESNVDGFEVRFVLCYFYHLLIKMQSLQKVAI